MQLYLILKLHGVMQAWGSHTFEDYRPSNNFPTYSGLIGLLSACLGIERADMKSLSMLMESIEFVVCADEWSTNDNKINATKLLDFHTVEDARKVNGKVREFPIVSKREYLCDARFSIAIRNVHEASISLEKIKHAVQFPVYTPYLGRRSCPITAPLYKGVFEAASFEEALRNADSGTGVLYSEYAESAHSRVRLRDVPVTSSIRQFATRDVFVQSLKGA